MNRSETATITVPIEVWGRLASAADHRGVKVADLLVESIMRVIGPVKPSKHPRRKAPVREVRPHHKVTAGDVAFIKQMTLSGASVDETARAIGMSASGVKAVRSRLGFVHVGSAKFGKWVLKEEA